MRLHAPRLLVDLVGMDQASIPQVWAARAARSPDSNFLLFDGECWTYRRAWNAIGRLAGFFRNVTSGSQQFRVGSYLGNCPEILWTWFGALQAGGVHVALNRRHKGRLLHEMIEQARLSVLVTDAAGLAELKDFQQLGIPHVVLVDLPRSTQGAHLSGEPHPIPFEEAILATPYQGPSPAASDVAQLMYTSGTTGPSKAVRQPHNMFCRGAARFAQAVQMTHTDIAHLWFPLCHIAGQLHFTMGTVLAGGAIALQRTFSASGFWHEVTTNGCTIFGALPNVISILIGTLPAPSDRSHTLRFGITGPQPPPAIKERFEERFGIGLVDTYGMTEAEPLTLPQANHRTPKGSCGRANPDFEFAVLDDVGRSRTTKHFGELAVRPRVGNLMMDGYEGQIEETLRAFKGLWFHTGDLGRIDASGYIFVVGRLKDMIRRRGENISAWELESLLLQNPQIAECAAVGVPSDIGEEDVKVVIVPTKGCSIDPVALHAWCRTQMAHFMIPRYIELRDTLPRTDVGKVAKELLKTLGSPVWDASTIQEPDE